MMCSAELGLAPTPKQTQQSLPHSQASYTCRGQQRTPVSHLLISAQTFSDFCYPEKYVSKFRPSIYLLLYNWFWLKLYFFLLVGLHQQSNEPFLFNKIIILPRFPQNQNKSRPEWPTILQARNIVRGMTEVNKFICLYPAIQPSILLSIHPYNDRVGNVILGSNRTT